MKRRDFTSLSLGTPKGDHHRGNGGASGESQFFLSRILSSRRRRRHHSKSRTSLDSDSTKSESSLTSHNVTSTSQPAFHNMTPGSRSLTPSVATASVSVRLSPTPGHYPNSPHAATSRLASSIGSGGGAQSEATNPEGAGTGTFRECPVCMMEHSMDCFPSIQTCEHRSCIQCLRHYLQIEISESRVNIACPECNERFHPNDMRGILEDERLMGKYEDFMLRRVLAMDPDTRWCPAPDCGYAVVAAGCAGCPKLKCEREGCGTYFCYHCKQHWHPNQTCDAARAERSPNMRSASVSYSHESNGQNEIKPCPRCGAFIVKMNDGSCNHMTCAVCAAEFCWLCMKEISDLHYLSPSGCTFWGRKPWSRKKKILWQLGTLVGAPVGITLVAGIAVPAMIIGIPVWVGRKIHARYRLSSKHRRNLAVTGGVAASILASPVVAGIAVGIGVPILLAYIYGVVPISLCRSGGCGVTTTNTGGVRFEFDEENEANAQGNFSGDNQSETMPAVANPSIAPSIGDASLGMTNSLSASGSHMDRVGVLRDADSDRDSASNRAIAGASLNGSLCGSTYTNKLEVQADVVPGSGPQKRASFSSESANVSLSEKSATVSFDETSLRVLCSDTHARDVAEACAETGESHDAVEMTGYHGDEVPISSQSPRPASRGVATDDSRHGAKCKKLTRFVDDVHTVTPSSNVVVTGDAMTTTTAKVLAKTTGEPAVSCVSPRVDILVCKSALTPDLPAPSANTDAEAEREANRLTRVKRQYSLSDKVVVETSVPLQSVSSSPARVSRQAEGGTEGRRPWSGERTSVRADLTSAAPSARLGMSEERVAPPSWEGRVMPEVDTDKPVAWRAGGSLRRPSQHAPSPPARSLSLSCSSLDRKGLPTSARDAVALATNSSSSPGQSNPSDYAASDEPRSLRRHSYELAYRHGRISPSLFDEPH